MFKKAAYVQLGDCVAAGTHNTESHRHIYVCLLKDQKLCSDELMPLPHVR